MTFVTAVRGMLTTDMLRMLRDRFLVGITVYVVFVFFVMRAAIPWVTAEIVAAWDFDLTPYHPLIVSHFVVQLSPLIPGIIGAFLLLESREDGTVKALLVAPYPLTSYVFILGAAMSVTAWMLTIGAGVIIGLALPPWTALIAVGLAGAPAAPMFALLVAAIANNKVQAFAYLKIFGLGPILATSAYFLPEPGQWLMVAYPPYCASKAYWVAEAGGSSWPLWMIGGLVSSVVWVVALQRLYLRAARN